MGLASAHENFAIAALGRLAGADERAHRLPRTFQIADDAAFTKNVRTLFNDDDDNSSKLGKGSDLAYIETNNGRVVDGTGKPAVAAEVAIRAGRIVVVGQVAGTAAREIDAAGQIVAPGFIDAHTHSDLQVLEPRTDKTIQGVTTEVIGKRESNHV